jgi:hypothetical protein
MVIPGMKIINGSRARIQILLTELDNPIPMGHLPFRAALAPFFQVLRPVPAKQFIRHKENWRTMETKNGDNELTSIAYLPKIAPVPNFFSFF